MGRMATGVAVVMALVSVMQTRVLGDRPVVGTAPGERLLYVFSPDNPCQRHRAEQLVAWVDRWGGARGIVALTGVVPDAVPGEIGSAAQDDLGFPLVAASWLQIPGLPERVLQGSDYGVLLDENGEPVWIKPGNAVMTALEGVVGGRLVTDVDESTWGKIKELFR